MRASIVSVLASLPGALAKFRACRGLITTAGSRFVARAVTSCVSSPPVASITTKVGLSCWRRPAKASMPFSSWTTCQHCLEGKSATSKVFLEMSIPTKHSGLCVMVPPIPCLADTGSKGPYNCSGCLEKDVTTRATYRVWSTLGWARSVTSLLKPYIYSFRIENCLHGSEFAGHGGSSLLGSQRIPFYFQKLCAHNEEPSNETHPIYGRRGPTAQ